ncbi:LPS export ABC transporter periplasmic protein LptC [Geobacter sp. DSM 9736]|uniref:LPS export ABC transporter periplasmic protein LptC n=1 Tax=Geobacter sp. DSM 9736 TaxID=1277350 RepID=UPI000B51216E|nr:LPS export ABC transporter periplasmic protein LptC [Geobacter sp. DSM 9736]SNB46425.1 LPS export ABC transporter protein LptC [Geobacter sp. DSM 9736]
MIKRNNIRQLLALVVVVGAFFIGVTLYINVSPVPPPANPQPQLPGNVDMSLQGIRFTETKNGSEKWDLIADRAEYDKQQDLARLFRVNFKVAGDRRSGEITITADRADYHTVNKHVRLYGNVSARSASGMEFTTSEAFFDSSSEIIRAPGKVNFADSRMRVKGVGMELHTAGRELRIFNGVTATIDPMRLNR